jgi:hypothetical protein
MALKLRRGSDAVRLTITPSEGELLYTTDSKKIFVGDGSTLGGTEVSGVNQGSAGSIPFYQTSGRTVTATGDLAWDETDNSLTVSRGSVEVTNESVSRSTIVLGTFLNEAGGSSLKFQRARGFSTSPTILTNGDNFGQINFDVYTDQDSRYQTSGRIESFNSSTISAAGTSFTVNHVGTAGSGSGPYQVTYSFVAQASAPTVSRAYTISGNSNSGYNGSYHVISSTTSSMVLYYPSNPGVFGTGTTTAQRDAIIPGTLALSTRTSNGNLVRSFKLLNDGAIVLGPISSEFTSSVADPNYTGKFEVNSTVTGSTQGSSIAQLVLRTYANTTYGQSINILRTRGTVSAPTAVVSGDELHAIRYTATDGGTGALSAVLSVTVDNTVSVGQVPGAFTFKTARSGTGSLTNAVKIDSYQQTTFYGNTKETGLKIISPVYTTVSSTTTYSLSSTTTDNVLIVTGGGYTATLDMPTSPVDGQVCVFSTSGYPVTVSVGTGTVEPSFTGQAMNAGNSKKFVYRLSNTTWYQIG